MYQGFHSHIHSKLAPSCSKETIDENYNQRKGAEGKEKCAVQLLPQLGELQLAVSSSEEDHTSRTRDIRLQLFLLGLLLPKSLVRLRRQRTYTFH